MNFVAQNLMPRLHWTVLTIRNETWLLWKWISKF